MNRTQLYLAGLLLVQLALILVFHSPFAGATPVYEARPLLPTLDAVTPQKLEIDGRHKESIELVKRDNAWTIESLGGFPADGEKVQNLLNELKALRVRRPVVSKSRYHGSFKVKEDDSEARIRLASSGEGSPEVDLIVGSSPNFRSCHVRLAGQEEVYEVTGLSPFELQPEPSAWIQRELVDVEEDQITSLALTNASGSFEIAKENGEWKLRAPGAAAGRALDQEKVAALLTTVASLRLSDGVGPVDAAAHGLASPAARLVVRWTGEAESVHETTVEVGGELAGEDSKRYVTKQAWGFTGVVWESSVRVLLEDTPDSLARS